jgi:hypothetical protein
MITSTQINKLLEDYIKTFSGDYVGEDYVSVYKNPSSSDYVSMVKEARQMQKRLTKIRFFAKADRKEVWVWNGYFIIHDDMLTKLGLNNLRLNNDFIKGMANFSGGVATIIGIDDYSGSRKDRLDKTMSYDWTWLDRYIKGVSTLVSKYNRGEIKPKGSLLIL